MHPLSSIQPTRTILLAPDNKNSILAELAGSLPNPIVYSVYGSQSAQQALASHLGFNGELRERNFGWYWLGKGYRAYNPILMRFHSPDSWSPFGRGGLNWYGYCQGDPRNFTDPTGHMFSALKLLGKSRKTLARASSTSSLTPLIPNTSQFSSAGNPGTVVAMGVQADITNLSLNGISPAPIYENIPIIAGMTPRKQIPYETIPPRYGSEIPPQVPSKQQPRFNDSGGQVGIISPNWKPNEPRRYRVAWESKPFEAPIAPLPPTRTLKSGGTREYYVRYDNAGNPTQSSVQKISMAQIRNLTQ